MAKRLVVCCDGTWNTPDQRTDGKPTPTNVAKLALGLAPTGDDGMPQRLFYHRGVGTGRSGRLRGGAFGAGLFLDVRDTYRFVVHNYQPGDELFFFGFSRGAFTARSTAGLIRNSGVLRQENAAQIEQAYALYRDHHPDTDPRSVEAALFRKMYSHEPRIRFIGVWDTVGALGIPRFGGRLATWFNRRYEFHNTALSSKVDEAYQALAIDERRGPFVPAIWSQSKPRPAGQRLEQVWFTGSHCDIGGGNPDRGLSDITLCWMLEKARNAGLAFVDGAFGLGEYRGPEPVSTDEIIEAYTRIRVNPAEAPRDSRKGIYRYLRTFDRVGGAAERSNEYIASTVDPSRRSQEWWRGPADRVENVEWPVIAQHFVESVR
ncbi:DUF2235 domain-containing protein [Mycobacterium sp. TNTM28]|uniref:DUF2235 domain-containing protein n=1 Tax=[Mycobacterium] fortunisiensis TaxID=2600579 RepID=A0ABS6KPU2_9MYCO|nr:DUF2235 domain-containing protein [[Mycobacterium] fortunisiensis]MBU9765641.1 DUF2235 domain-containing protein [[Mycobacterium] fortunisiensis]